MCEGISVLLSLRTGSSYFIDRYPYFVSSSIANHDRQTRILHLYSLACTQQMNPDTSRGHWSVKDILNLHGSYTNNESENDFHDDVIESLKGHFRRLVPPISLIAKYAYCYIHGLDIGGWRVQDTMKE